MIAKNTETEEIGREEVDKYYVSRLNEHIGFPINEESIKLFRRYRDKILKKQIAADNKRFQTREFLETSYRQLKERLPKLDLASEAGAILFTKHVLGTVLEITAFREASMSFMLQIYEGEILPESGKELKTNLKLIK